MANNNAGVGNLNCSYSVVYGTQIPDPPKVGEVWPRGSKNTAG